MAHILCASRIQPLALKSTMASEFIAALQAMDELLYFHILAKDLGTNDREHFQLLVDNQAAVGGTCNPIQGLTTKYLDVHYKYVGERVENVDISVLWVDTSAQVADMLTKALSRDKLMEFCEMIGLID
jgi:hypothetical protein